MAGLIQKQMMGKSQGDEQNEQEPVEGTGPDGSAQHEGMEGEAPEANDQSGEANADSNPAFKQAVAFAMQVLYEQQAAKDVSTSLKSAPSVAQGMADVAYNISSIVDEKTNGAVPDELLMLLGMKILEEIADIAEASGLHPSNQDVADAFKQMLLRFLQENGMDTSQLQQAMDQIDPSVYDQQAQPAKA